MSPVAPKVFLSHNSKDKPAVRELKNRLTKQTVDDAVQQYKRDRPHW